MTLDLDNLERRMESAPGCFAWAKKEGRALLAELRRLRPLLDGLGPSYRAWYQRVVELEGRFGLTAPAPSATGEPDLTRDWRRGPIPPYAAPKEGEGDGSAKGHERDFDGYYATGAMLQRHRDYADFQRRSGIQTPPWFIDGPRASKYGPWPETSA